MSSSFNKPGHEATKEALPGARTLALPVLLVSLLTVTVCHGLRKDTPGVWYGITVAVQDGDTLTVLTADKVTVKVRLLEIDAPERGQPHYRDAKQFLANQCFQAVTEVSDSGKKDRWGRTLARVSCHGLDASTAQVSAGWAWAYTAYVTDPTIPIYEEAARLQKEGIWADPDPTPPWDYRKRH